MHLYSSSTGPPQSSTGLTTELTFLFSWNAPLSPPTVQLNYIVTVTNTNTSVVMNFTTSNTAITLNLTREDVEGNCPRGCGEYLLSVIDVNAAGTSNPAIPVTLPSGKNNEEIIIFVLIT